MLFCYKICLTTCTCESLIYKFQKWKNNVIFLTHPSNGKQNPDHGLRLPAMSPLIVRVNIQIVIALLSDLQNAFWLFDYLWPQLVKETVKVCFGSSFIPDLRRCSLSPQAGAALALQCLPLHAHSAPSLPPSPANGQLRLMRSCLTSSYGV